MRPAPHLILSTPQKTRNVSVPVQSGYRIPENRRNDLHNEVVSTTPKEVSYR